MKTNDLTDKLRAHAASLAATAEDLMHEANLRVKSSPRTITLVIPLGMFAGTAIDTLGLANQPAVVHVGEKRMGGVDYSCAKITVTCPLEFDPEQWEHVGSNTFVWRD